MLTRSISLLVLGAMSPYAYSNCARGYEEQLNLPSTVAHVEPTGGQFVACEDHPTIKNIRVFAIASPQSHIKEPQENDYDLKVALINKVNKNVIAHGIFNAAIRNGGGPKLTGISVDSKSYPVAVKRNAFGIRTTFNMSFTRSEELNLFVFNGKAIANILSGAETSIFFTNQGGCMEKTREAERSVFITNSQHNGYRDLVLKETRTDSEAVENSLGECALAKKDVAHTDYELRFDGKRYRIPTQMEHFECGVC
jgi:hypothetical protein